MTRADRHPETDCYIYFNANPHNRIGCDCVIRAICTALNQSWETTVRELTEVGIRYGYVLNDQKCYEKYLEEKGWVKHKQPRCSDNSKYTGEDWCRELNTSGDSTLDNGVIIRIGGHHMSCILPIYNKHDSLAKYKIHDIWNCSYKCIGNYWTKG